MEKQDKYSDKKLNKCIIVMGTYRSGTSVLAGCLHLSGVNLGKNLILSTSENEMGYFENQDLNLIHESLLHNLGYKWDMVAPLPQGWINSDAANIAKSRIKTVIKQQLQNGRLWAVKDPCLCRIWPIWRDVLNEIDISPLFIVMLRHPHEVASSLKNRNGFELHKGRLLWLMHNQSILDFCLSSDHVLITYDEMLADPITTLQYISHKLGVRFPNETNETREQILNFVRPSLRRHQTKEIKQAEADSAYEFYDLLYKQILKNRNNLKSLGHTNFYYLPGTKPQSPVQPEQAVLPDIVNDLLIQLGNYERKELRDSFWKEQMILNAQKQGGVLYSQVFFPSNKENEDVYSENRSSKVLLVPDKWQKITVFIPNPEALRNKSLRFVPLNTTGLVKISSMMLFNAYNGKTVWSADAESGFLKFGFEGTILLLPDKEGISMLSTGEEPIVMLPHLPELPDCPLNLEVWLHVSRDMSIFQSIWDSQIRKVELLEQQIDEKARLLEDAMAALKHKSLSKGNVEKHIMSMIPQNDLKKLDAEGLKWESTGDDPQFYLVPFGKYPDGYVLIDFQMKLQNANYSPKLYWDAGEGLSENNSIRIPISKTGKINYIVKLPKGIKLLRFDPTDSKGVLKFANRGPLFRKISWIERTYRMLRRVVPVLFSSKEKHIKTRKELNIKPLDLITNLEKTYYAVSDYRSYRLTLQPSYNDFIAKFDTLTNDDRKAIKKHINSLPYKPKISVIMPVYNTPEVILRKAIESVINQLYPHWELCIADDASTEPHVRRLLQEYAQKDSRIKIVYREKNGHISAASNSALEIAQGEFVAFLDHDDELAEKSLYRVAVELNAHPDADIIYSDEDLIDEHGNRFNPHFKSDWNPEFFFSNNYICHLSVIRTSLLEKAGRFREGFEGSQDYDLLLRCVALTDQSRIRHIPEILYHWRAIKGSTALAVSEKIYAVQAGIKALNDFFSKNKPGTVVEPAEIPATYRVYHPVPDPEPKVSLIIPTRNGLNLLSKCVNSILSKTEYSNYEIIIVDNQSDDKDTIKYLNDVSNNSKVHVIQYNSQFNFSAINNYAVKHSDGEIIGLINNDIEVITPDWLKEMVSYAIQPGVGAVGAKLLYPDGRVQHAGIILGVGGVASHSHKYMSKTDPGYFGRAKLPQALSAVTAACMIIRRKVYEEVGGFDEENLAVTFNDVDFCLKLRDAGYRNVWTPYALLYHHESATRGYDDTPEKQERFEKEILFMKKKWGEKLLHDPYYNPNLTLDSEDFSIAIKPRILPVWRQYRI